jgi:hypothetical protein
MGRNHQFARFLTLILVAPFTDFSKELAMAAEKAPPQPRATRAKVEQI